MMILGPSQCLEVQPSTPGISACPKGDTPHTCIQMFRAPAQILSEAPEHYYNGDQASGPSKYRKHGSSTLSPSSPAGRGQEEPGQ